MIETFKVLMDYITTNNVIKNISFWVMSKDNFIKRPRKEVQFFVEKVINEAFEKFAKDKIIKEQRINIRFYGI